MGASGSDLAEASKSLRQRRAQSSERISPRPPIEPASDRSSQRATDRGTQGRSILAIDSALDQLGGGGGVVVVGAGVIVVGGVVVVIVNEGSPSSARVGPR